MLQPGRGNEGRKNTDHWQLNPVVCVRACCSDENEQQISRKGSGIKGPETRKGTQLGDQGIYTPLSSLREQHKQGNSEAGWDEIQTSTGEQYVAFSWWHDIICAPFTSSPPPQCPGCIWVQSVVLLASESWRVALAYLHLLSSAGSYARLSPRVSPCCVGSPITDASPSWEQMAWIWASKGAKCDPNESREWVTRKPWGWATGSLQGASNPNNCSGIGKCWHLPMVPDTMHPSNHPSIHSFIPTLEGK